MSMQKKFKQWVCAQVALKLDAEPFSSLPLRMRTGIFLIAGSFIISYGGPVVAVVVGRSNDRLLEGALTGTALYVAGWIVGGVGLIMAGKDSIRYPLYFFAKFLHMAAPGVFAAEETPAWMRRTSPFVIVTLAAVLVIAASLLAAKLTGNWSIFFITSAATAVLHQMCYLYGMFSADADFFFVSQRGKDLSMARGEVLFRFDDGPDEQYTPRILDLMQENGMRAIFAVTGENVVRYPHLIRRMQEEGHIIANHTFTHSHGLLLFSFRRMCEEMIRTNEAIQKVTGTLPMYFCPPVGFTNPVMGRALRALSLTPLMWDVRSLDTQLSTEKIVARVRRQLAPGKILLFHDAVLPPGRKDRSATVEAVRILCEDLRKAMFTDGAAR